MKCPQCGYELEEGTRFCTECGAQLVDAAVAAIPSEPEEAPVAVTEEPEADSAEEAVFAGEDDPTPDDITEEPIDEADVTEEPEADSAEDVVFDGEADPSEDDVMPEPIDEVDVTPEPENADDADVTEEPAEAAEPAPVEEPAEVAEPAPAEEPAKAAEPAPAEEPAVATAAAAAAATVVTPSEEKKDHPLVPSSSGKYVTEKPIGILRWTGLDILFHLPFVRFVMTIVWSVTPVRPSLKNYARARLLWNIVALILTVIAIILLRYLLADLADAIGSILQNFATYLDF